MLYHSEKVGENATLRAGALRTDLQIAFAFAEMATKRSEPEMTARNRRNARKGYDVLSQAAAAARLTHSDRAQITNQLESLKNVLRTLGESF